MKNVRTSVAFALAALLLLMVAPVRAQQNTEQRTAATAEEGSEQLAAEGGDAQAEANAMVIKAYEEARKLHGQGKIEAAASVLASTAGTLGEAPQATVLRWEAIQLLLGNFLEKGIGRKSIEYLLAEFIEKSPDIYGDQVYIAAASIYPLLGNYEPATNALKTYLEKFPPPTEEDIKKFSEALKAMGQGTLEEQGVDHPRITARRTAQRMLERFSLIGKLAPHFELKTLDGEKVSPRDFKGKVLLVDFWATWCPPCLEELPNVKETYEKYHAKGFEILGLSVDEDKGTLAAFVKEHKLPWKQVFLGVGSEKSEELGELYKVVGIPATFLIDRGGIVRALDLRGKALQLETSKLMEEKPAKQAAPLKNR